MTGSVATLTPIPSATMIASHRIEVIASGTTAATTAGNDLKTTKHSTTTAPYTHSNISRIEWRTTMLVVASNPAGPAAIRKLILPLSLRRANRVTVATTELKVSDR